jgi:hypothetical protein
MSNKSPARESTQRLASSISALSKTVRNRDKVSIESFAAQIQLDFVDLRQRMADVAISGHVDGLRTMSRLAGLFESMASTEMSVEYADSLMSTMSAHFPVSSSVLVQAKSISNELMLRLFREMLVNEQRPEDGAVTVLDSFGFCQDVVLPAFVAAFDPEVALRDDTDFPKLGEVLSIVADPFLKASKDEAIEFVAAHLDLIAPTLQALVDCTKLDKYKEAAWRLKNDLRIEPEALAQLYQITGNNVIKNIAEMQMDEPKGLHAYKHLESMGIVRSVEWHAEQQASPKANVLLKLHAYAIKTEGVAIDTTAMKDEPGEFRSYVELLEGLKASTPDEHKKCQVIFDALVRQAMNTSVLTAGPQNTAYKPLEILCDSSIPHRYFDSHLNLRGKRFTTELGV